MPVLLKIQVPVEAGNAAIVDGSLPKAIKALGETHDPEAAYFLPESGKRTALFVFDIESSSRVPLVAESLFHNLNASATITPVMTPEDLLAGLEETGSAAFGG